MRVLVLSNLYPPFVVGGYERLCFEVTSALVAKGHVVRVLTSTHGGATAEAYPGQPVTRELRLLAGEDIYQPFPGTPEEREAVNRANIETALRVMREFQPEVVFAWNLFFFDASLLEAVRCQARRTVLMLTDNWLLVMRNPHFVAEFFRTVVHGDAVFAPPASSAPAIPKAGPVSRVKGLLRSLLGRAAPSPALEAIFGSEFVRDFYAAGGMTFEKHRVIHNGVKQMAPSGVPDRTQLGEPGVLRLLFAGRLVDLKGADTAVAAMRFLDAASMGLRRVELTVVGDTQDRAYMSIFDKAVQDSGCADRIEIRSTVPEAALPVLFAEHDIYIFPSLYEPFSLTLIHAMALEIPTVASAVGGNLEIIADGESGLLFPKGDAEALADRIRQLAVDPELRARIAAGGHRSASRFTFARMVSEMSDFLDGGDKTRQ